MVFDLAQIRYKTPAFLHNLDGRDFRQSVDAVLLPVIFLIWCIDLGSIWGNIVLKITVKLVIFGQAKILDKTSDLLIVF